MLLTRTSSRQLFGLLILSCSVLFLSSCQPETKTNAPAISETATPDEPVYLPDNTWSTYGGSLSNQRYSPLDEINRNNITELKAEWETHLGSGLGQSHSAQGEPVVVDGVIYLVTGENDVFAMSVDTGEILWKYTANIDADGVIVCCGWTNRGVSVDDDHVYVGTVDARLLALDINTGEVVWETQVEDPGNGYSITGGTRYYDGKVYIGLAGGEYGVRGSMQAFDAESGERLWKFWLVPGPGEFGHDTWPQDNDAWRYGGAPVWQTVAIDPELNMIFFATGNASPDLNGAIRPGDNLFTVSLVALDAQTGEYRWHFQQTRHDIWDYDSASPVVLFDVDIDGVERKGLSQISKSGYLFFIDRVTGEPLTPVIDTPVPQLAEQFTAATQPIPQGDHVTNHCLEEAPEGWELPEGGICTYNPFGYEAAIYTPLTGTSWPPTSYDPEAGILHVCASESVGGAVLEEMSPDELAGYDVTGSGIIGGSFRVPRGVPRIAYQVAMNVRDHTRVWKQEVDSCSAGSVTTAGGLLLSGRGNRLVAYDSATGEELWDFTTAASVHANAAVFEHDGKQKIVVFAGGSVIGGTGPKGDSVWLLSLDGTLGPYVELLTDTDSSAAPSQLAMPEGEPDLARGQQIYNSICQTCHGEDGQGGHTVGGAMPADATLEIVFNTSILGVDDKMPSFEDAYTPMELKSVAAYVLESVLQPQE